MRETLRWLPILLFLSTAASADPATRPDALDETPRQIILLLDDQPEEGLLDRRLEIERQINAAGGYEAVAPVVVKRFEAWNARHRRKMQEAARWRVTPDPLLGTPADVEVAQLVAREWIDETDFIEVPLALLDHDLHFGTSYVGPQRIIDFINQGIVEPSVIDAFRNKVLPTVPQSEREHADRLDLLALHLAGTDPRRHLLDLGWNDLRVKSIRNGYTNLFVGEAFEQPWLQGKTPQAVRGELLQYLLHRRSQSPPLHEAWMMASLCQKLLDDGLIQEHVGRLLLGLSLLRIAEARPEPLYAEHAATELSAALDAKPDDEPSSYLRLHLARAVALTKPHEGIALLEAAADHAAQEDDVAIRFNALRDLTLAHLTAGRLEDAETSGKRMLDAAEASGAMHHLTEALRVNTKLQLAIAEEAIRETNLD
jgi:hypothetical protein